MCIRDRSGEQPAEQPTGGAENVDEAMNNLNNALRQLETARDGSFEEYGRALDQLDRAVKEYQDLTR